MRHRALILAAMLLAAPALAGDLPAGGAGGRYVIGPARDGFVRLDTATGAASHCAVTDGTWRCEPLPGDDAALKSRVDALSADVARLTAAVSALDARLANLPAVKPPPSRTRAAKPRPPAGRPAARRRPPPEARRRRRAIYAGRVLKPSVAATSSRTIPGSVMACPASATGR